MVLVGTSNLFGSQGEVPTHPQLLDWLGEQFVESGWSIKAMHRLILNSSSWQQAATADEKTIEKDPDNRLWGRFERRRLEGEAIRDGVLAVSGLLDSTSGGAHPFPADSYKQFSQGRPFKADYVNDRRSVYQMTRRNGKDAYWELFDAPDRNQSTAGRRTSTVPMQALFLMNSDFVRKNAEAFAKRLEGNDDERVRQAFLLAYGRQATRSEVVSSLEYLNGAEGDNENWLGFCRALISSNEFVYVE